MVKMGKQKKQKQNKTKKISGGRPKFIKMYAQHTKKGNVVYRFVYDDFNEEDQKKIAEQDKVYYSVKNDDSLMDELKNQVDVLNEEVQTFFYKKPVYSNDASKNDASKKDYKTIIIRNQNELKKIEIAENLIKNMNLVKWSSPQTYNDDIPGFIKEYKKFINTNEDTLLKDIEPKIAAKEMLNSPAFLNIIGMHYGFITAELKGNLDKLKEQMDSTTTGTTTTATATTTATTVTTAPPKSLSITQKLKEMLQSKSK